MQVEEVEPNVHKIEHEGMRLFLIGTAHVSAESAAQVERYIREVHPSNVLVELCPSRLQNMREPDRWKNTDIFSVVRSGKGYVLFAQLLLAGFQKRLAGDLGIMPGAEMKAAISVADELGIPVTAIDREVRTTLKRAWANASLWTLLRLVATIIASPDEGALTKESIEELKQRDMLHSLLGEFRQELPDVERALIQERDLFMASRIQQCLEAQAVETLVAVVGAGHVPGMLAALDGPVDCSELDTIPPPSLLSRVSVWLIPAIFVLLLFFGLGSGADLSELLGRWALATGGLAALGAILTLAHPLTILSGFVAAPFTTLHPLLAAGWICALVEAFLRRPRVSDLQKVTDDISSVRGIYRNRALRVLLILCVVNLTTTIGVFIGLGSLTTAG